MEVSEDPAATATLTAAQRARVERNQARARVLLEARRQGGAGARSPPPPDAGGGFLAETARAAVACAAPAQPPAPVLDPTERPECLECGCTFAQSHLYDTFEHAVCDGCRDDEGAHALLTRTEAKAEYLLRDADLDARSPALRCVRRRNPHAPRGDMRLYLRAQVEARALLVWGSEERLEEALEERAARRASGRARRGARALRALRMSVRSSLYSGLRAPHVHAWLAETYDAASDTYSRACACGQTETYEKM